MDQKNEHSIEHSENRHSVRINSRILFAQKIVSREYFDKIAKDCQHGISLYNRQELAEMQVYRTAQDALERIKEKDKDLAVFLQHIDGKLDALMKKMESTPSLFDSLILQKVNLGGNGLAFWSSGQYAAGDLLEMHIVIPLDNYYINCFAEVIEWTKAADAAAIDEPVSHRVAVKFILITEQDKEVLVRFNFKQQSQALQSRRLSHIS